VDIFITGTDTDVGKTLLSAVLVIALDAAYWKPIQTGRGEGRTDRETLLDWTGLEPSDAPREAHAFDPPVSPHLAARNVGTRIDLGSIRRPAVARPLIIEGAGGVMVPLNETEVMLDLMAHLGTPVVVAARTTLGTINHTLLTVEAIRRRSLELHGIVLIGEENPSNREAIEHYGNVRVIGWIPPLDRIDRNSLRDVFRRHFDRPSFES
jgi:dethiobiotin synthase